MSDLSLPGVRVGHLPFGAPLRLRKGESTLVPRSVPDGTVILDPGERHRDFYTAVKDDQGYLIRFFAGCDVRVTEKLDDAVEHRDPDADPGLIDVLLAGTLLAIVANLRGQCVLHASAVEVEGRALAFVGHSGMGKSTLALAACAAGARLIAEDVLAIVVHENGVDCLPGNTDMRLRKSALSLLQGVPDATRFQTPDGRQGVRPNLSGDESIRLDTVVIPRPMRSANELSVVRLPAVEALFRLMNFPRVDGLIEPGVVRTQFQGSGVVARSVPVLVAEVPWRQPLQPNLGRDLLALMSRLPTSSDPA